MIFRYSMSWRRNSNFDDSLAYDFTSRSDRLQYPMLTVTHNSLIAVFVVFQLTQLPAVLAQNARAPEECEALEVWQSTREERIEQEFQLRGISDAAEKQLHRAEVERVIDQRIQRLKELCKQKKNIR